MTRSLRKAEDWVITEYQRTKDGWALIGSVAHGQRIMLDRIYEDGLELLENNDMLDVIIQQMEDHRVADFDMLHVLNDKTPDWKLPIEHLKKSVSELAGCTRKFNPWGMIDAIDNLAVVHNMIEGKRRNAPDGLFAVINMLEAM